MAFIEIYEGEDTLKPLFVADFDFLPLVGQLLARDTEGYFKYYKIVEIWHRQDTPTATFQACASVILDD